MSWYHCCVRDLIEAGKPVPCVLSICFVVLCCVVPCREVLYETGADGKPVVTGLRIGTAGGWVGALARSPSYMTCSGYDMPTYVRTDDAFVCFMHCLGCNAVHAHAVS
jgi:hypothetical protein